MLLTSATCAARSAEASVSAKRCHSARIAGETASSGFALALEGAPAAALPPFSRARFCGRSPASAASAACASAASTACCCAAAAAST